MEAAMSSEQSQVVGGRSICGDIRYEFTGPMLERYIAMVRVI
jgi:hypothetical protein